MVRRSGAVVTVVFWEGGRNGYPTQFFFSLNPHSCLVETIILNLIYWLLVRRSMVRRSGAVIAAALLEEGRMTQCSSFFIISHVPPVYCTTRDFTPGVWVTLRRIEYMCGKKQWDSGCSCIMGVGEDCVL
jgi:hypothetical protein